MNEYDRGFRDGYFEGTKDYDSRHAVFMAQYQAMVKHCAEIDLLKPRVIMLPKDGLYNRAP